MADLASPACNFETRKTAPGLNLVDCGQVGDDWWRLESQNNGLIKDNHITFAGGITNALKSVDLNLQMEVEVETRTIEDIEKVLEYASQTKTSLTQIMLDNVVVPLPNGDVDVSMLKQAVKLIDRRFKTEASGNVTLETVHKIGQTRVDFISRFWFCAGNKIGTKRLPRPIHFKRLPEVTSRGGFLFSLCLLFPSTNEIIVEDGRQSQDSTSKPKHG